jgi:hypothetical protein
MKAKSCTVNGGKAKNGAELHDTDGQKLIQPCKQDSVTTWSLE